MALPFFYIDCTDQPTEMLFVLFSDRKNVFPSATLLISTFLKLNFNLLVNWNMNNLEKNIKSKKIKNNS